ncbi:MAG: outer membrane beta-barrel protein, partial [Bdellovibrionales bacterium]
LPSFVELGVQFFSPASAAPAFTAYGQPDNQSSIVHNFEIGYDRQLPPIDGAFTTAIFYQYNDEMQGSSGEVSTLAGPIDQTLYANFGDSQMYGIELGLEGVYKQRWDWGANYTYVNVEDELRNQQNSAPRSAPHDYENTAVNHILNANVMYNADQWRAGLWGQYRSSFDDLTFLNPETTNTQYQFEEIGDQVVLSANFSYDLTDNVTWSVSGTGIIGDTRQHVGVDAEEVFWTSLRIEF